MRRDADVGDRELVRDGDPAGDLSNARRPGSGLEQLVGLVRVRWRGRAEDEPAELPVACDPRTARGARPDLGGDGVGPEDVRVGERPPVESGTRTASSVGCATGNSGSSSPLGRWVGRLTRATRGRPPGGRHLRPRYRRATQAARPRHPCCRQVLAGYEPPANVNAGPPRGLIQWRWLLRQPARGGVER